MAKETNGELHNGLPQLLSLDTICKGAVIELGDEALKRIAANMADVNTEPTQKRKIVLTIEFAPYNDRTGAAVSTKVETKLAGMKPADGTMFIAKKGGEWLAFGRDTRQLDLLEPIETDPQKNLAKPH